MKKMTRNLLGITNTSLNIPAFEISAVYFYFAICKDVANGELNFTFSKHDMTSQEKKQVSKRTR